MNQLNQKNCLKKTRAGIGLLLFLMIFVSPLLVLQFLGKEVFLWLQIVYVLVMIVTYKKIRLVKSPLILIFFLEPFITAFFAQLSSMPDNYKRTAINLAIMSLPLYFVICYINNTTRKKFNTLEIIVKALKAVVIVELIWFAVQLALYRIFGFDINQAVFVNMLHMVDNASFIRDWKWYPSGLSWHSAVLAPLFVIGILLWNNTFVRIAILIESFFCGNSTTLIGVLLCFFLLFLKSVISGKIKVTRKKLLIFFIIAGAVVLSLAATDIGNKLITVVGSLWERLFGANRDASTSAHFGYYSDYISIIKKSNIFQTLFGYGIGCSGYTITSLYGRYADGGTWAIECDIINILVSRGIIGFINYYFFLFYILIKGRKIDFRYFVLIFVVFVEGFGYNIQFDYLFLTEAVLFISIKNRINFFDIVDKVNCRKRIR